MIKAIFFMAIGALGFYLYQDPSQWTKVQSLSKIKQRQNNWREGLWTSFST